MATLIANPYANLELRVPASEHDAFKRLTTTFRPEDGTKADIDRSHASSSAPTLASPWQYPSASRTMSRTDRRQVDRTRGNM